MKSMYRIAFWLSLAAVTVLSLMPVAALPPLAFDIWDKAQHAGAFFGLAVLATLAFPQARLAALCAALVLYGAGIEGAQQASGWRQGDWLDLLADSVGVVAGLGLVLAWRRFRQRAVGPTR